MSVVLRPLHYRVDHDATGRPVLDANGRPSIIGKREKGMDVPCAPALIREARRPGLNRAVVLASRDSDLEPALDEALDIGGARIETFRWASPDLCTHRLHCSRPLWCTAPDEHAFIASRDLTPYA